MCFIYIHVYAASDFTGCSVKCKVEEVLNYALWRTLYYHGLYLTRWTTKETPSLKGVALYKRSSRYRSVDGTGGKA